ncbi:MAG: tRNA uridine-5-carboxymethylaminomethyl(34) synthesis GTPase MnmE [Rhodocyclales bacterium]|nr:tRNA uridine-5-carboxymethylaminomethyl(34) synthesis GTPase MnmE [Rhodocyclales bacterium]
MKSPRPPTEVIAAVATAPGRGGIGVVRLSGPDLAPLARQLTGRIPAPRVATLARFLDASGGEIDQGLALYFPAPHSYTGEDVLELQGHGGPVVLQLLLARCVELGAHPAQPGEFTRRAFLNDKLDLAQAEAVADLIEASTAAAARSAVRSLAGEFSAAVQRLVERLIELRMLVEATLDFPEEELDFLRQADAAGRLAGLGEDVATIRQRARKGSLLRSGLHVVLAGQPNVGKSSLLNRLAGEERAIVTAIPGTTRDALRETIQVHGIPLHIIDTAGLREAADEVERLGVSRTWREIERADVVLLLLDAREGLTAADGAIAARLPAGVERIDICNKADLVGAGPRRVEEGGHVTLWLSARTGEGVELLEAELLRVAGWQAGAEDVFMARERHLQALARAGAHLAAAQGRQGQLELFAEELRLAQEALAEITGEFTPDDLLGEIFSRFCIGK